MGRNKARQTKAPAPTPLAAPVVPVPPANRRWAEWPIVIVALTLLLAPTFGVSTEEMLQDTLKSMIAAAGTLGAAIAFFWHQRHRTAPLAWHGLLWFPLILATYAFGSMAWSHTYLAGVEAIRWCLFAVLLWVGLNTFERDAGAKLAWAAHAGAVMTCLWGLLQFWIDLRLFPQGPNPASTFVNRNFAAEFVVSVMPMSLFLLARARNPWVAASLALSVAFNVVFLLATGTRSALVAFGVILLLAPIALWRFWPAWAVRDWSATLRLAVLGIVASTIVALGTLPTANQELLREHATTGWGVTPIARAFHRGVSIGESNEYTERSFSIRITMWKATVRMIEAHPLAGVGAGAWEVVLPLHQTEGSALETDFYVHNEILQLLAEYGLAGLLALLLLVGLLSRAGWRTWADRSAAAEAEGPMRSAVLLGLLAFLLVSNAGFPWRLAATGLLFAVYLALVAASDIRLDTGRLAGVAAIAWRPVASRIALVVCGAAFALGVYISWQATLAERYLVRAVKLALTVAQSGNTEDARWQPVKAEIVELLRRGIAITPHYRKITPMVADEMAKWGDWSDAIWVYESVASSRPYVPAVLLNIARGYSQVGDIPNTLAYLDRARKLHIDKRVLPAVEVVMLGRSGRDDLALQRIRQAFASGEYDLPLTGIALALAKHRKDWDLAIEVLERRMALTTDSPARTAQSWLWMGHIEAAERRNPDKALVDFRSAMTAAPVRDRSAVWGEIPVDYQQKLSALRPALPPSAP